MFLPEGFLQLSTVTLLLAAVIVISVVYIFMGSTPESVKTPPGPPALPLLGNLLSLDLKRLDLSLVELSKTYGSVFTVHLGPMRVVVLAGYKTVKEALVDYPEEFGSRLITPIFHDINQGHGIIFANGNSWKEMRRFALSNLRDFGMGRKGSEEKIIEEIQYLTEVFEAHGGKPFDTTEPVNCAVSNIISSIVYGDRFDYADPVFQAMVKRANHMIKLSGSPAIQLYNIFPFLGFLLKARKKILMEVAENIADMKNIVKQLQQTLQEHDKRGFVDAFLIKQQELSGQRDSHFHDDNLIHASGNMFGAGTETTGTTLRWGLLLMAKYPHIQKKVQEEIEKVVGTKQPRAEHRRSMPYTDAVIHEIQRLANVVPLNLPHMTAADVHFQGYFIKKGTPVFPLLTSVLQDETQWETPHQFNPAHFLDPEGQFVKKDAFMAFSAGRRACLGESLARMELFLFFTSLLQKFTFSPPPGVRESELDLTPVLGLTMNPSLHQLCALRRA
ncbi:cytochrome P450 2K1-like [Lepisosteus oculatus]|uniref:cytochrome P450 2K1-like n=1 Tax=Lepisosteus oculatus TaxID=7918 RepID=UPI0035F50CEE